MEKSFLILLFVTTNVSFYFLSGQNTGFSQTERTIDHPEFGVLLEDASFWIGDPEESTSMAFLKISAGKKIEIRGLHKGYYKIIYRDLLGFVEKKAVKLLEPATPAEAPPARTEQASLQTPPPGPVYHAAAVFPDEYTITQATSLRNQPDSQAKVLTRLLPGEKVKVLESSGKYWWKVDFNGKTGWVKCALMKKN